MTDRTAATARVHAALDRGERPLDEDLMVCDTDAPNSTGKSRTRPRFTPASSLPRTSGDEDDHMNLGEPDDVEGECNAHLYVGDNFSDNHATMRCQREPDHDDKHRETYESRTAGTVVVEWERDERPPEPTERVQQVTAELVAWLRIAGLNPEDPAESHSGGLEVQIDATTVADGYRWAHFVISNDGNDQVMAYSSDKGVVLDAPLNDASKARAVAFLKGTPC